MVRRRKIPTDIQRMVRQRANHLCEYCHTSERWQYIPFTIDHIIPISQGGTDQDDNLALACFHCNRRKGGQISAIDPLTREQVGIFNPRQQDWNEHFSWAADRLRLVGLTPLGRATVAALDVNRERILSIRAADRAIGRHPPAGDPILKADSQ